MKSNKGITLIALVITIIVMLILVAVTISMAVNGGLFGYASDAATQTKENINAENELGTGILKVNISGNENTGSINSIVGNLVNGTEITNEHGTTTPEEPEEPEEPGP